MQITVKVKYGSENPRLESFGNNRFLVYVSAGKENDDAVNEELAALFSKHFGMPIERIKLRSGMGSDSKIFDLN